jgi:hypothetical protein
MNVLFRLLVRLGLGPAGQRVRSCVHDEDGRQARDHPDDRQADVEQQVDPESQRGLDGPGEAGSGESKELHAPTTV